MVMTNLDAGMSMEINPPGTDAKMFNLTRVLGQRAKQREETLRLLEEWWMATATLEADQHRAHCDTKFNMFCSTTQRDGLIWKFKRY